MGRRVASAVFITVALSLAAATGAAAQGQQPRPGPAQREQPPQPAAPKPYKAVAITEPAAVKDAAFEAFRKQLGAAADKKDRKALAGLVVAQGFFWMSDKGDRADKKKSGIDNLAKAIGLDGKDAHGWEMLTGSAADPTGTPYTERKDTICAPADPNFNGQEFDALTKATGTEDSDWAYPTQAGIEVRASAQPNSPVVEKLGLHFVRVMEDGGPGGQDSPMLRVATPSGKIGFVPADALSPLGNDQICYSKDGAAWKISGFIGGDQ